MPVGAEQINLFTRVHRLVPPSEREAPAALPERVLVSLQQPPGCGLVRAYDETSRDD